jgi:hypothetical protein
MAKSNLVHVMKIKGEEHQIEKVKK